MEEVLRILIAEDSEDDALLIMHHIKKGGYNTEYERVETAEKMQAALKEKTWDIILSDYKMPHFNGLKALTLLKESEKDIPFLVISGTIGEDVAVEMMKAGAHDYIMKNNLQRLLPAIQRELRESKSRAERKRLEQKQRQAEQERLAHLRFFESMAQINRAIHGTNDLEQMMSDVLGNLLSIFDCDRAWLLYPCDPETRWFRVPMEVTKPEYPGAKVLNVDVPMSPGEARNMREALESDSPVTYTEGTARPITTAKQFGVLSQIFMPIHPKQDKPWVFGMHQCSYPRVWTPEETRLFQEIGRRLADGLTSLLILRDLKESEEKYRTLIHKIQAAVVVHGPDTQILSSNSRAHELLGFTEEQITGKLAVDRDWHFFLEDGTVMPVEQYPVNRVLVSHQPLRNYIVGVFRPHNEKENDVWVLVNADPVFNKNNEITQVIVTFIDITKRKRAEVALQESEAKTRSILDNLGIGVALISPKMEILELNQRMRTMFPGIEPHHHPVCYHVFNDPPFKAVCDFCPTTQTLLDGQVHEAKTRTVQAGVTRDYRIISFPILNAAGEVTSAIKMIEDITEKLSLESQLQQAQKMESIGRLAGGVAHDFNNMLGVIIGHTDLALNKMKPTHRLFNRLQEIHKAAERSANLTRQLLAFSRKQTVTPRVLDLNQSVEGMLKMLRRLIGEDIHLTWLPGKELWSVRIDPSQIDQILANLCVNSRDAIQGVGHVTIETHAVTFDVSYCATHPGFVPGQYVQLTVSDDGCGMSKEILDKLFEPFFTTKEIGKGTGLGLATVYGIAKQNNGFINVYSEPGHGAIFNIYLPQYADHTESIWKESPVAPPARGHETILMVEDEPTILELGCLMLEDFGYQVLTATTPSEALRVANEHGSHIHLLISDVIMPEMNGKDLAKKIISLYPNIKIMFMSGYTCSILSPQGVLDKSVHFIQKPFSMSALAAKVREALDSQ